VSHYTTHPSEPMEHIDAVKYLRERYEVPSRAAADLLIAAKASETGMASLPLPRAHRRSRVWANHMTTQGGRFIIEDE
jgi:hypothetical protein